MTIDGGMIEVGKLSPEVSFQNGQIYRLIDAGALQRNADFVLNQPFLFLTADLQYGADYLDLMLTGTGPQAMTGVAETFNQRQAAAGLANLGQTGDALSVYNELLLMTDPVEARAAYDAVSGEMHAWGQHLLDQTFGLFSDTLGRHRTNDTSTPDTVPLAYSASATPGVVAIAQATASGLESAPRPDFWLTPFGGRGVVNADGNAADFDWSAAGLAAGAEMQVPSAGGDTWLGIGVGYGHGSGSVPARLSSAETNSANIGIYGGWAEGPWTIEGGAFASAGHVASSRRVLVGGMDRIATADYWTQALGFSAEVSYGLPVSEALTISPLATLDARWLGHGGFAESGAGALNLVGTGQSWSALDTGIGLALTHEIPLEDGALTLEARAVWEHAWAAATPKQTMAFVGGPTEFDVLGATESSDRLSIGAGLTFETRGNFSATANYGGVFSAAGSHHTGSVSFKLAF